MGDSHERWSWREDGREETFKQQGAQEGMDAVARGHACPVEKQVSLPGGQGKNKAQPVAVVIFGLLAAHIGS
jgi:hypothetical protein